MPSGPPPGVRPGQKKDKRPGGKSAKKPVKKPALVSTPKGRQFLIKDLNKKQLATYLRGQGYNVWAGASRRMSEAKNLYITAGKTPAKSWNKNFNPTVYADTPNKPTKPVKKPTTGANGGGGSGGGGSAGGGNAGGGWWDETDPVTALPLMGDPFGQDSGSVDGYAEALTALQYDPQIAELKRQQELQRRQAEQNRLNIDDWYNQVMTTHGQSLLANQEGAEQALQSFDSATSGLVNALPGDASGLVAGAAQYSRGGLQGIAQSQENFDNSLSSILQMQENDAQTGERNIQSQLAAELAGNLRSVMAQRGQSLVSNTWDAQNQRQSYQTQDIQNQAQMQNLQIAQMLLPAQMQEQFLRNQGLAGQNAQAGLDYETTMAQFEEWRRQQSGQGGGFGELEGDERQDLAQLVESAILGPQGNLRYGPSKAYSVLAQAIRRSGYNTGNPAVAQFIRNILGPHLPSGWDFGPGGFPQKR